MLYMTLAVIAVLISGNASAQETEKGVLLFSHMMHIEDLGAECITCHPGAETSVKAEDWNMPTHEECMTCHDGDTAREECTVCHGESEQGVAAPAAGREYKFNHASHLAMEGKTCDSCHTGLDKTDLAVPENLPPMETCVSCHNDAQAPQNCEFCHTQTPALRPASHKANWITRHDDAAKSESEDCTICHSASYCQECHEGAQLVEASSGYAERFGAAASASWGNQSLIISKIHDLNYRYTHALDAKSKTQDCQLCHRSDDFCSECHATVNQGGPNKPVWHGGADWGALAFGRGTGGGQHALLAKRDISNCSSCHDANGEDPVCLLCHMDRTPGKNNDLRTHSSTRYNSTKGPWHDDDSFVCFTCHVKSTVSNPNGFCGYCHIR